MAGGPFQEWLRAIKGEDPMPGSNFDYSAGLTEMAQVGILAQRFNKTVKWDADKMKVTNSRKINAYVKEPVRKGWEYGDDLWT